jgi:hypothetical protein
MVAYDPPGSSLGLLDVQCWARDPQAYGKRLRRHQLPLEQKESVKWLTLLRGRCLRNVAP